MWKRRDTFSCACQHISLIINLRKANVIRQGTDNAPTITNIEYVEYIYMLEAVHLFTYLGSTVSDSPSTKVDINRHISRAWKARFSVYAKMRDHRACVLRPLLYGSVASTLYFRLGRRLNTFCMFNLRHILGIKWQERFTLNKVLTRSQMLSFLKLQMRYDSAGLTTFTARQMTGFQRTCFMENGSLARDHGRNPHLRFKDICKPNLEIT